MWSIISLIVVLGCLGQSAAHGLSYSPPSKCKNVESIVHKMVKKAMKNDPMSGPPLMALHFVDCMINGCDGSAFLMSSTKDAERDVVFFLEGFGLIDSIKLAIDDKCGSTVSCADILTIAARDVVSILGGPYWKVQFGRLDGSMSSKTTVGAWVPFWLSTVDKPAPGTNGSSLSQSFKYHGLGTEELVSLSGSHTVGRVHCATIPDRISEKTTTPINSTLKAYFKDQCTANPPKKEDLTSGAEFDLDLGPKSKIPGTGGMVFDNSYFKNILKKKGALNSDQALGESKKTKYLVELYANDQKAFFKAFSKSMVKMGGILPSTLKQMKGGPSVPVYPGNKYGIFAGKCTRFTS